MFHVEKNKPVSSHLCVAPVDSPDNLRALSVLLELVGSCSGPRARIHMVRNSCGGHVTMTSDSQRLLASLSLSRQVVKLVLSCVQGHQREHGDGGKFLACACLSLIMSTVQASGGSTSYRIYCDLYEQFVQIVSAYLDSKECAVCLKADLTNVLVLLAYTRSLLSTRPLLNLTECDCNKISELIVKCFVESIPGPGLEEECGVDPSSRLSDGIFIVGSPLEHPRDSRLLKGLMLECPDLPCVRGEQTLNLMTTDLETKQSVEETQDSSNKCVKVALVTCSMSGDLEDIVSATFEVTTEREMSVENLVLEKWAGLCERLARRRVGLLLCQKVIHPRLKVLLRSLGVMALDRLGSAVVPYIRDLCGARPIVSAVAVSKPEDLVGRISSGRHVILNDKSYLHIQQPSSPLVTLVLCSSTEERLEEFRCCVKASLKGLYSLLREEKLLAGGGCWQIHCSYMLADKVRERLPVLAETAGCTQAQVLSALSVFRSAVFHHWARLLLRGCHNDIADGNTLMVDPGTRHCWRASGTPVTTVGQEFQCCCGLLTTSRDVSSAASCCSSEGPTSFWMLDLYQDCSVKASDTIAVNKGGGNKSLESTCTRRPPLHSGVSTAGTAHVSESPSSSPPLCGSCPVTINTTLDQFSAATQGLYRAVFTANLVLSLGQVVSDTD